MDLVVLDIVLRKASRESGSLSASFDAGLFEIRLQDGPWTPFSAAVDEAWAAELAACRAGDVEAARAVGARLATRLELAGWSMASQRLLRAVAARRDVRVRVRAPSADLLSLPWDWMPLTQGGEPLHAHGNIVVERGWTGSGEVPRSAVSQRARLRGTERVSVATAGRALDADTFVSDLLKEAHEGGIPFSPARDWLQTVTPGHIDRHLRAETHHAHPVSIFLLLAPSVADGTALHDGSGTLLDAAALEGLFSRHAGHLRLLLLLPTTETERRADTGALTLAVHRAGVQTVIGARAALHPDAARCFATAFTAWLRSSGISVQEAYRGALELLAERFPVDAASMMLCHHSGQEVQPLAIRPWPGLSPYRLHHAAFFAGRRREVGLVLDAISDLGTGRRRFLAVSAAAGSGLRSLLYGGVLPRLLSTGAQGLRLLPGETAPESSARRVVVAEGFASLFDEGLSKEARDAHTRHLWGLAHPQSNTLVLLVLPSSLLGRCGELAIDSVGTRLDTVTCDTAHHVLVPAPGHAALQEMVERPAASAGLVLEEGLSERIATALRGDRQPLPRLGAVLVGLWESREGDRLSHASYDRLGGVEGAFNRAAEAAWDTLDAGERELAKAVLLSLAGEQGADGRPRNQDPSTLADQAGVPVLAVDRILTHLHDHGLVQRSHGPLGPRARLVSQALVDGWPRLQGWLADARAAALVQVSRPANQRTHPVRGLMIAAALVMATVVVGLGSAWAGREQSRAVLRDAISGPIHDPTETAVQLRQIDTPDDVEEWVEAARSVLSEPLAEAVFGPWEQPVSRLQFDANGRVALAQTGEDLRLLDPASGEEERVPLEAPALAGALAPDGAVLAADRQGSLWRWDGAGASDEVYQGKKPVRIAAFSPSGDTALLVSSADWTLLDARGTVLSEGPLPLRSEVPRVAAVADGGRRHVVAGQAGSVLFWSSGTADPSRIRHPGVRRAQLNRSGTHLLTLGDGRLRITDVVRGTGVSRTPSSVRVDSASFDSNGTGLAVDYTDLDSGVHRTRHLKLDQRAAQVESGASDDPATNLVLDQSGERVFRGRTDGTIEVRSLEDGELLTALRGHLGRINHLVLSPDRRWLASTAADGQLRIWPTDAAAPALQSEPEDLRLALWDATGSCSGLEAVSDEAWCACERCNGREPASCVDVPGGLRGLLHSLTPDATCPG